MRPTYLYSLITYLALSISISSAQQLDSALFVSKKWEEIKLRKGISWKKAHFDNLFGSKQLINIIEIDLNRKNLQKIGLEALPHSRKKTSFLADSLQAIAAINGGFFDMKNGGAVDYIKVNDKVINYSKAPTPRADAYFAFNTKQLIISKDSVLASQYSNVLLAGPLLIENKKNTKLAKNSFNDNRHPRTALAIKDKKLIFLTVDGRHSNAEGLSLNELANIFKWYNCQEAMNLDGGGSTTMFITSQPNNGVVNYPSDNKTFDHQGERTVSNIIYVK